MISAPLWFAGITAAGYPSLRARNNSAYFFEKLQKRLAGISVVIYVHAERNGGYDDDNQRRNEKIQAVESHHAGGHGMPPKQDAELRR